MLRQSKTIACPCCGVEVRHRFEVDYVEWSATLHSLEVEAYIDGCACTEPLAVCALGDDAADMLIRTAHCQCGCVMSEFAQKAFAAVYPRLGARAAQRLAELDATYSAIVAEYIAGGGYVD